MNRTLKDLVRAMLVHNNVPDEFWAEALCTAAYIRNRVTSRALPRYKTPFHVWFGKAPDVAHLRVFGCRCWYKINKPDIRALDNRACEAMMLGYSTNQKAYKLWDLNKGEVTVSRDVVFDESKAAYTSQDCRSEVEIDDGDDYNPDEEQNSSSGQSSDADEHQNLEDTAEVENSAHEVQIDSDEEFLTASDGRRITPSKVVAGARRSTRQRRQPSEWWKTTALSSVATEDPLTFSAATKGEDAKSWQKAIDTEVNAINENKTWTLVPRS